MLFIAYLSSQVRITIEINPAFIQKRNLLKQHIKYYITIILEKVLKLQDNNLNEWMTHLLTLLINCQELVIKNKISDHMRIRKTQVEKIKDENSMWDRTSPGISISFACFTIANVKLFPLNGNTGMWDWLTYKWQEKVPLSCSKI